MNNADNKDKTKHYAGEQKRFIIYNAQVKAQISIKKLSILFLPHIHEQKIILGAKCNSSACAKHR